MASEWARKKAEEFDALCQEYRHAPLIPQGRVVAAFDALCQFVDEARAEGEAKATAVLHDLLTACWGSIDPEQFKGLHDELSEALSCEGDGPCAQYGRDLDNARAEGRAEGAERERWECNLIAQRQAERYAKTKQGYCVDACLLVRDLIRYRGPMRGPEEGE